MTNFNNIGTYGSTTSMRESETERENGVIMTFSAKDEVRRLGASEWGKVMHRMIRSTDIR